MNLNWKSGERQKLLTTSIFTVESVHRKNDYGQEGDFINIKTSDWVNIIPIVKNSDGSVSFVMERQFRHGIAKVSMEFPAGIIEEGEEPSHAAFRELEEETGMQAGKLTFCGTLSTNPAIMTNHAHFFIAEDLVDTHKRHLDENEQIEVVTIREDELHKLIGSEELNNSTFVLAYFFYLKGKLSKLS